MPEKMKTAAVPTGQDDGHRARRDARRDAGSVSDRQEDQDGSGKDKRLVQREVVAHRGRERDGSNPSNRKEFDAANRAGCPRICLQVHGLIPSIVAPALKCCAAEKIRFFIRIVAAQFFKKWIPCRKV